MSQLNYNPLRYFWLIEYEDGKAYPQFDPNTGKPNLFKFVDAKRIRRAGWYPFSEAFADKVSKVNGQIVIATENPIHTVELKDGEELVMFRRNLIRWQNPRSPYVTERETFYLLGVKGKRVIKVNEQGKIMDVKT